jgi:hypothetical protein
MSILDILGNDSSDDTSNDFVPPSYVDKRSDRDMMICCEKAEIRRSQKEDGHEFFLFVGEVLPGSKGGVRPKGSSAREVEVGEKVSVYVSLSETQKKSAQKKSINEVLDFVCAATGEMRKDVVANFSEHREALLDGMPEIKGKTIRLTSKPENQGWFNYEWNLTENLDAE